MMLRTASLLVLAGVLALAALDEGELAKARGELKAIAAESARMSRAFNLVHQVVGPSVVSIKTREQVFESLGGWRGRVREVEVGEGSGFVIASDAQQSWILTNAHVVVQVDRERGVLRDRNDRPLQFDRLRVVLHDNREEDASYVGIDERTDLALLRVPVPQLPVVEWADSDRVQVGDWVVALGYPLGVGYSATAGIVSATDRSTGIYQAVGGFESFIQTDAPINPGNSGGPLVDLQGRILGVNANIVSRSGGSIGLGFAIPANLARRVADDLRQHGRVRHPIVGIQLAEVGAEEVRRLGLPPVPAVRVAEVVPMSPAAAAGLAVGDLLLAIDDGAVNSLMQFRSRVATRRPGEQIALRVWREGKTIEPRITLASYDDLESKLAEAARDQAKQGVLLPAFGLRLAADGRAGLAVAAVESESIAEQAGLAPGDRILAERGLGKLDAPAAAEQLITRREIVLLVEKANGGRQFWLRMRR
jgi:S1-C subfamily serine protease